MKNGRAEGVFAGEDKVIPTREGGLAPLPNLDEEIECRGI